MTSASRKKFAGMDRRRKRFHIAAGDLSAALITAPKKLPGRSTTTTVSRLWYPAIHAATRQVFGHTIAVRCVFK